MVTDVDIITATVEHLESTPRHEPISPGATVLLRTMFEDIDRWTVALREAAKRLEVGGG